MTVSAVKNTVNFEKDSVTVVDAASISGPYDKLLDNAKSILENVMKTGLEGYYDLGTLALKLMEEPKKYGNRTIETFAENTGWDTTSAYDAATFAKQFQRDDLVKFLAGKVSWRGAQSLIRLKDRDAALTIVNDSISKVVKGEKPIASEEIRDMVKAQTTKSAGTKTSKNKEKSLTKNLAQIQKRLDKTMEDIAELIIIANESKTLVNEETKNEIKDSLSNISSVLSNIRVSITEVEESKKLDV